MHNTFVCTWRCFFPKALAPERNTTYSVHVPACTHTCMCVCMYMCISLHVLALEPRRTETEWTWQSRLLGTSQIPTCGPSSGPSQSRSPVSTGKAPAWGARWHSCFSAGLQRCLVPLRYGWACSAMRPCPGLSMPASFCINFFSIFSFPSLKANLERPPDQSSQWQVNSPFPILSRSYATSCHRSQTVP